MNRVIYTSADTKTPYYDKFCRDTVEAWAERCGAELINLPAPKDYQPQWVIFDAFRDSIERGVEKAAWIDCDIVVQDDAPIIFDEFDDKLFFCPPDPPRRIHPMMRRNYEQWGMPNPRPYVITALGLWSPRHVEGMWEWFEDNRHRFKPRHGDQELLTVALYELERHHALFPQQMHRMTARISKNAAFMHSAGSKKNRKLRNFRRMIGLDDTTSNSRS